MTRPEVIKARKEAEKIGYGNYLWNQLKSEWDTPEKAKKQAMGFFFWVIVSFLIFGGIFYTVQSMTFCNAEIQTIEDGQINYFHSEGNIRTVSKEWNMEVERINNKYFGMIDYKKAEFKCAYNITKWYKQITE